MTCRMSNTNLPHHTDPIDVERDMSFEKNFENFSYFGVPADLNQYPLSEIC